MISITGSYSYTGSVIIPSFTAKDGALLSSSDYTSSCSNNENVGTATLTLTASNTGNYSGTAEGTFSIAKAVPTGTPTFTKITTANKILGDTAITGTFKNPNSNIEVLGTLTWNDGDKRG